MKTLRRGCWPLDAQSGLSWIVRANDARTTTAPPWWPAGTTSTVVRRPRSTAPELKRRHRTHLAQDPDTSKRRDLSDEEDRAQRRERSLWHPHGLHGAAVLVLLRVQRLALHLLRGQRPRLVRDDAADAGTLPHPRPRKSTLRMVFVRLFPSCRDAQAPLSLLARRLPVVKSRDGRPGRTDKPSGAPRVDQADRSAGRCDGGAGRDSSSAAPTAVTMAAARNAVGIPLPAATSPSNMGPPSRPRSMKTLAVLRHFLGLRLVPE
jgi:hypothetical protein